MALADSLLSAIVRADGDALVMHVGERPYVVVGTQTINISTHGLHLEAMTGMLTQLLPADAQGQLEEFGAVEYKIPFAGDDRFTIVAARGGDDIWIEIRRRRGMPSVIAPPAPPPAPPPAVASAPSPETPAVVAEEPPSQSSAVDAAESTETPQPDVPDASQPVVTDAVEPALAATPAVSVESEPVPDPAQTIAAPEPTVAAAPPEAVEEIAPLAASNIEPPPASQPEVEAAPEPAPPVSAEPSVEVIPAPGLDSIAQPIAEAVLDPSAQTDSEPVQQTAIDSPAAAPAESPAPAPEPVMASSGDITLELLDEDDDAYEDDDAVADEGDEVEIELEAAAAAAEQHSEPVQVAASVERPVENEPATAMPMTRTVRIEVPPRAPAAVSTRSSSDIERLLRAAVSRGAGSLFFTSGSRPWMRVEGELRQMEAEPPLSRADVERTIRDIVPESGLEAIGKGEATEWISEFDEIGRIRCTTFNDHRGPGLLLRMIATRAATAEQLGLSSDVQALATESQGLVLVAGSRAGGKSTLMSALVDLINKQRAEFVITLERQIRLVHDNKLALVSQREIRGGADESVAAARAALRENPDVLVVDDLVSPHMVPLLLTAASEGLLVFVALTAQSTADAISRFIELAPPEMRKAVQASMAESFRGAVGQVLLKKSAGGLLPAREMMLGTATVARMIGDGQLDQLPSVFEGARTHGMVSFTDALVEFVRAGSVDIREAFRKAPDRSALLERLKTAGVDTAIVERLA